MTPVEQRVSEMAAKLQAEGIYVALDIEGIPNVPFETFQEFIDLVRNGELMLLRRVGESGPIFDLLATKAQRAAMSTMLAAIFLTPVAAIALGFFVSWWFLAGLASVPVVWKQRNAFYNRVLFRSAFKTELLFSFLYTLKQVIVQSTKDRKLSFEMPDIRPSPKPPAGFKSTIIDDFAIIAQNWPPEQEKAALDLLGATMSGNKEAIEPLWLKLTSDQRQAVVQTMEKINAEIEQQKTADEDRA